MGESGRVPQSRCEADEALEMHQRHFIVVQSGTEPTTRLKPWPHRASASASTLASGPKMGIALMLGVRSPGINQCGLLQLSTLRLRSVWLDP